MDYRKKMSHRDSAVTVGQLQVVLSRFMAAIDQRLGQEIGPADYNQGYRNVAGPRKQAGKGGIISSDSTVIPSEGIQSTYFLKWEGLKASQISGQEICDLTLIGSGLDQEIAEQLLLTLKVNGQDNFAGVVRWPANRAVGGLFSDPASLKLRAGAADQSSHRGAPILPESSSLILQIDVQDPAVLEDLLMGQNLRLSAQVGAGTCV